MKWRLQSYPVGRGSKIAFAAIAPLHPRRDLDEVLVAIGGCKYRKRRTIFSRGGYLEVATC